MMTEDFSVVLRAIEQVLEQIDLVVIELEPFEAAAARSKSYDEGLNSIDIGRVAVLRAAAKDPKRAVLCDPRDRKMLEAELARGATVSPAVAQRLAANAFARVAAYDASVAGWIAQQAGIAHPPWRAFAGELLQTLRYGENPHQTAAFYRTAEQRFGVATARQVQGKELSYNNINDTDAAYECVAEFSPEKTAACVIVKHANPCGAAEGPALVQAYRNALACDPVSAFGGIIAVNRCLDAETARAITEIFTEVIIAPAATEEAVAVLSSKKNLRLLIAGGLPDPRAPGVTVKSVAGGFLVQSRDNVVIDDLPLTTVTKRSPSQEELRDLTFAFRVAKHVKSNAIVYAKDGATVGIGAGQMSRVDSASIAVRKAQDAARSKGLQESLTTGSVVASDAFFPFADGLIVAAEAGVTAVIQPGGSARDGEVIQAADDRNIAMVFTSARHFRH
jgi:phosphoribosylaminoimidazolecarboxamide formyltransferase/IMP cyclohydrolase